MTTVTNSVTERKPATAYYGILDDEHGVFLHDDQTIWFRDDATEHWRAVDLPTFARWAVLYGEVNLAEVQRLADGDRVRRCSQTLSPN